MIRIHKSQMHDTPVVYFFRGLSKSREKIGYLYAESMFLFGGENTASVLIEFESEQELSEFVAGAEFRDLQADLDRRFLKKATFLLTSIQTLERFDFRVTSYKKSLSRGALDSIKDSFETMLSYRYRLESKSEIPELFSKPCFEDLHFGVVHFDKLFVRDRSFSLSPRYHEKFSPDRYVDSQIPLLMLGALLSERADSKRSPHL